jgi:hypothetical protein
LVKGFLGSGRIQLLRAHLTPIISFYLVEMKWHDDIISFFARSIEMTGYPIGVKVRHEMKDYGIP